MNVVVNDKAEELKRDESRGYIKETHDLLISVKIDLQHHKETFARYESEKEKLFNRIFDKLSESKCPKEETINNLVTITSNQDNLLRVLHKNLAESSIKLNTILSIAEGRKSVWREVGLFLAAFVGVGGFLSGIVFGVMRLMKG